MNDKVNINGHCVEQTRRENVMSLAHEFKARCILCQRIFMRNVTIRELVDSTQDFEGFLRSVEEGLLNGFKSFGCS